MCCSEQGGPGAARLGGLQGDEGLLLLCLELQTVLVLYCRKIRASCFVLFVIDTKLKEIMSKGTSRRRRRWTSRSSSSPSPRYSSPPARASPTVSGRGVASGRSAEPEQVGPGRTGGAVRGTARRRSHSGGGEVEHVRLVCTVEEAQDGEPHGVLDHGLDGADGDVVARPVVHQPAAAPGPATVVAVHTAPS